MDKGSNAKAAGRRAGLVYLVLILFSFVGYTALTRLLNGDSRAVLARLVTNETPFTLALVASVIGFAAWTVLAILLYKLMSPAGRISALLMVLFSAAGTAMNLIALAPLIPFVRLATAGLDAATVAANVQSYHRLVLLAQIFSGLWMFPFGWLVLRSRIAPRFLGSCLIVGGFFWVLLFATAFKPALNHMMAYQIVSTSTGIAELIGEFGMCLLLLLKGAPEPELQPQGLPQHA